MNRTEPDTIKRGGGHGTGRAGGTPRLPQGLTVRLRVGLAAAPPAAVDGPLAASDTAAYENRPRARAMGRHGKVTVRFAAAPPAAETGFYSTGLGAQPAQLTAPSAPTPPTWWQLADERKGISLEGWAWPRVHAGLPLGSTVAGAAGNPPTNATRGQFWLTAAVPSRESCTPTPLPLAAVPVPRERHPPTNERKRHDATTP